MTGNLNNVYLQRNQQRHGFDAVVAAVDVVSHEEVVSVGRLASDLEQLHQVVKLAVDISAHRDGTFHLLHVGLLRQNLTSLHNTRLPVELTTT